ncbi:MAG TPA: RNA methyltransferase [bacterium]|nr:RNA methyltransferase [bacterium]HPR86392.1 RNA methyltransferase [bacterium]
MIRKLSFAELDERRRLREHGERPHTPAAVVLLDDIRSLHNVGAIFRTADGAGFGHLYLCGITGTPPRNEIRKTSLGAEESVPWSYHADPLPLARQLKAEGYQLVVLEQTNASTDFTAAPWRFPLCLIIGHEYTGVREALVELADLAVEIPMDGSKHSLNVSVAFGIAAYEIARHRDDIRKG